MSMGLAHHNASEDSLQKVSQELQRSSGTSVAPSEEESYGAIGTFMPKRLTISGRNNAKA